MNGKIKLFGAGAAILLILVSIGPAIVSAEDPTPGIIPYADLASQYQSDLDALERYIDEWYLTHGTIEGIQFTSEQQQFLNTFTEEAQQTYAQYGISSSTPQQPPRFWGINGIFDSKMPLLNPKNGNYYNTVMVCINHNLTVFWGDLLWNMAFLPTFLIMGAILFIIFGLNDIDEWIALMAFIWIGWRAVRELLQLYDGESGILFYHWIGAPGLNKFAILEQPDYRYIPNSWILIHGEPTPNPDFWNRRFA